MRKKRHPLSGAVYEEIGAGLVRVEKNGLAGIFRADGSWVEGDLTYADPHMIVWVGGCNLPPRASVSQRGPRATPDQTQQLPEMVKD